MDFFLLPDVIIFGHFRNAIGMTQTANAWTKPQSYVQQAGFYQTQSAAPQDKTSLMKALNMINQNMQIIESKSQRLQEIKN